MKVLVTGATGLIGGALVGRLAVGDAHEVIAVTRGGVPPGSPDVVQWSADFRTASTPEAWIPHLEGVDAVVNCAGVLQDSARDSTAAAHHLGPAALFKACAEAGVRRVIHLSAIGADRESLSDFSRSKQQGDAALMALDLDWVILRPSVVLGRPAYGGSALFRGLAALPVSLAPDAGALQVVQLDDLLRTITFFLQPGAPSRLALEIAGPERQTFESVVRDYRRWLRFPPARQVRAPRWLMRLGYCLGDLAGALGWRPPIRSTARLEMARGAVGDPHPWTQVTGIRPKSLSDGLAEAPASVQERWFARLYLLKPLILGGFSAFWIVTGIISLTAGWRIGVALMREGGAGAFSAPAVVAGAVSDLAIGAGIAYRPTARVALYAALCLSLFYVVAGSILLPRLWADPLGPMLKIWPVLALNLVALAILEDR